MLITGGTGFLAQGLVRQLLTDGCKRVCVYSRGEFAQSLMRRDLGDDQSIRWFVGDVRDRVRLERAMLGVDYVIHAAALKRIEVGQYNPDEMVKTNVLGTMNVIEAASRAVVQKVVFVSSDKAFEPVSPYGQTKALAESLVLNASSMHPFGPRYAVVRYGNVWNSTGSILPTWRRLLEAGAKEVPVRDPDATRFFMRLQEAVELVLGTLKDMRGGEIAIPRLPAYRVADLAAALGVRMRIEGMDYRLEKKHEAMAEGVRSNEARRMSVVELREELARVKAS